MRGCESNALLNACPQRSLHDMFAPKSDHGANAGMGIARGMLQPIKKKFPSISHGDLWALAGVVDIEEM